MVRFNGNNTVVWMMCDAILQSLQARVVEVSDESDDSDLVNPLPVGTPIRRPLYVPVKLIDFALPAE
jgi:hypothetical protein